MAIEQQDDQTGRRRFNPNDHLTQLKNGQGSQDYLPVQWRLVWFRENCPQGTIDTQEMEIDLDRECEAETWVWDSAKRQRVKTMKKARGYARFKAVVTDGKGGRGTGTKSENAANFADYIEKAETGAIGRALASLGYGTQFAPELNEEHRIVDAPVERSNGTTEPPITEQQITSIERLAGWLELPEAPITEGISYIAAKKLIEQLGAELKEKKAGATN
jgi:hypothetical protein